MSPFAQGHWWLTVFWGSGAAATFFPIICFSLSPHVPCHTATLIKLYKVTPAGSFHTGFTLEESRQMCFYSSWGLLLFNLPGWSYLGIKRPYKYRSNNKTPTMGNDWFLKKHHFGPHNIFFFFPLGYGYISHSHFCLSCPILDRFFLFSYELSSNCICFSPNINFMWQMIYNQKISGDRLISWLVLYYIVGLYLFPRTWKTALCSLRSHFQILDAYN